MHYRQNWQGILSICRKAGKLAMGLEPTKDAMYRGTVSGVLVASDASAKTRKEAAFYCGQAQVPCLELHLQSGLCPDDRQRQRCAGDL